MKIDLSLFLTGLAGRAGELFFRTHSPAKIRHAYTAPEPWQDNVPPLPLKPKICKCECFILCDRIYQTFTDSEKLTWRTAVKKRGYSGYDLWMHECMIL